MIGKELLGANMPLFQMRIFDSIETVGTTRYIQTYYAKYILDNEQIPGDYTQRRIYLKSNPGEYKLYPLSKICNSVQEMLNSTQTHFIDNNGKVLHWKKTVFYDVLSLPVMKSTVLGSKVELFYKLPEGGLERAVTKSAYKFVYAVKLGQMNYLPIDFGDEFRPPCKKKL